MSTPYTSYVYFLHVTTSCDWKSKDLCPLLHLGFSLNSNGNNNMIMQLIIITNISI